jgi:hypothetical protein
MPVMTLEAHRTREGVSKDAPLFGPKAPNAGGASLTP